MDKALEYLRGGETLGIAEPDRPGRSVRAPSGPSSSGCAPPRGIDTTTPGGRSFFHVFAATAQFEHDLVVEHTQDGLAAARARGREDRSSR